MKLPWILFLLLVAMCGVMLVVFSIEEVPRGHGFDHPDYPTMQRGGEGETRHEDILLWGWLIGLLQIAFFVALLAFGAWRREGLGRIKWPLLVGLGLYALVFSSLVWSYRGYMKAEDPALVLSFPAPTAWMLYGIWLVPVFFIVLYVWGFDRWILSDEDLESFRRLVAENAEGSEPE